MSTYISPIRPQGQKKPRYDNLRIANWLKEESACFYGIYSNETLNKSRNLPVKLLRAFRTPLYSFVQTIIISFSCEITIA